MDRANVPKTAIDEDRNLPLREYDVRPHPGTPEIQPMILSEPVPETVQPASEKNLRTSVSSPDGAHIAGAASILRRRIRWMLRSDLLSWILALPPLCAHGKPN